MDKRKSILSMVSGASVDTTTAAIESEVPGNKNMVSYRPELVYGYEPDFISGYKLTCGKRSIGIDVLAAAIKRNENIQMYGPSGAGKSTTASAAIDILNADVLKANREIHEKNLPLIEAGAPVDKLEKYNELNTIAMVYNGHVGTNYENMVGTIDLVYDDEGNRKAVRVPGFLTYAFITPRVKLIWDEMDYTPAEALGAANIFLDGRSTSINVFVNGRWALNKQEMFSVIATTNSINGENQQEYAGVNPMNGAFRKRFLFKVQVDFLPEAEELALIMKKFPTFRKDVAEKMIQCANATRQAKREGLIEYELSTRELFAWIRGCQDHPEQPRSMGEYWRNVAGIYVYTSFLNAIEDEAVRDGYETYFSL